MQAITRAARQGNDIRFVELTEFSITLSFEACKSNPGQNVGQTEVGLPPITSGLSLAYIGTDSGAALRDDHDFRSSRFRLGDKKEAAGGAVAVISLGYMEIECSL